MFDSEGQLLNATLADYLLPTALDVPRMELEHTVTPSPLNPLGVKGAGEAGAIPGGALFAQALEDALELPARGIHLQEIPLSPNALWELTKEKKHENRRFRIFAQRPSAARPAHLLGCSTCSPCFPPRCSSRCCAASTQHRAAGRGRLDDRRADPLAAFDRHLHPALLRLELQLHRRVSRHRPGDGPQVQFGVPAPTR